MHATTTQILSLYWYSLAIFYYTEPDILWDMWEVGYIVGKSQDIYNAKKEREWKDLFNRLPIKKRNQ
jgi:hypothetical protein